MLNKSLICLCCGKKIINPTTLEGKYYWHQKCIKSFFDSSTFPEITFNQDDLNNYLKESINEKKSITGVQKKFSLGLSNDHQRLTLINYPAGYILKPPSNEYNDLPLKEFVAMKMAESTGIKTVPNGLLIINNQYYYITKRIDRIGDKMIAMEDFCQLSNRLTIDKYHSSYEQCGKIIKKYSHQSLIDLSKLLLIVMFSYLIGNSDLHLKNLSLISSLEEPHQYQLSNTYDFLPVNQIIKEDSEELALTLDGKKTKITSNDFKKFCKTLGINLKIYDNYKKLIINKLEDIINIISDSDLLVDDKTEWINIINKRIELFK